MAYQNQKYIDLLNRVANIGLYRFLEPQYKKYPNCLTNATDALMLFIEAYGFEHQGRNPSYAQAAVDAIKTIGNSSAPNDLWGQFTKLLAGTKLNERLNPLFHEENTRVCDCILCIMEQGNIIGETLEKIDNGKSEEIWNKIIKIRGIGPKIASLFIRDLVIHFGITPKENRFLYQPIDIWVRRGAHLLGANQITHDEQIACWITENFENPEQLNHGLWYFGALISQSEYRLTKALHDIDYAYSLVDEHINSFEEAIREWRKN